MTLMMQRSSITHLAATGSRPKPSSRQQQQQQQSTCSLGRPGDTCQEALECGCPRRMSCCGFPQCCRELNNNSGQGCCDSSKSSSGQVLYVAASETTHSTKQPPSGCTVCKLAKRLAEGARIASGPPEVSSPEPLVQPLARQHCTKTVATKETAHKTLGSKLQNYSRVLSFRQRRLAMKLAPLGLRKRKPAPLPPLGASWSGRRPTSADSSDSGNTSGAELNSQQEERIEPPNGANKRMLETNAGSLMKGEEKMSGACKQLAPVKTLDETEIFAIEHFLRSHKSSSYVCRCMANLYLTGTRLDEAGRWSKPDSKSWQLSKTGVPVLTFDSGLTRNRPKRRLTISLCERVSGFVIWSDTIDHLSNYRAYSERLHGTSSRHAQSREDGEKLLEQQIDTFHLMYLSTNHRLMAGLSFDDPHCARLFLKQVELISSDPINIALTGPKLAARRPPGSGLRLATLLACGIGGGQKRISGSWRGKRTTPLPLQQAASQEQQQDHSWSTLRLACHLRLARRQRQPAEATTVGHGQQMSPHPPKSLAQQVAATTGLSRRRTARKCDISAPCLFQHVTRVDAHCLERLQSGSLVTASCLYNSNSRASESALLLNKTPSDEASSISSTSSCYSTVGSQHASSASSSGDWTAAARPKPPVRRTSTATQNHAKQPGAPLPPPPPPPPPPEPVLPSQPVSGDQKNKRNRKQPEAAKIQAIIRELQAQSLGELVETKRRLMADIAHCSGSISHL